MENIFCELKKKKATRVLKIFEKSYDEKDYIKDKSKS